MKCRLAEACELTSPQRLRQTSVVSGLAPMEPLFAQKTHEKPLASLIVVDPPARLGFYDYQLEQAIQFYQERLYKAVYRLLKSHDPVEDILQLTWIKLHNYLVKSERLPAPLETLYPWLWVIARNMVIDFQKKQQRLRSLYTSEGNWLLEPRIRTFEHPDKVVIRREIREEILKALCSLDQKPRIACTLYFFYKMRLSDIAVQLQCNLNTVKSYIYRDGIPALHIVLEKRGIQVEDVGFWAGCEESTLEQYQSGMYSGENQSST